MFSFLQRLSRLFVVLTIMVAVGTIIGFTSISGILVASHHNASSAMQCAVTSAGVGNQLVTSGHGFAANSQYLLYVKTPAGSGVTTATTDGSGSFTVYASTTWPGTYGASVWSEGGGSRQLATCTSTTA